MAPLVRQQKTATSANGGTEFNGYVNSWPVAPTQAFQTGNAVFAVVMISGAPSELASVTDTSGHTWTRLPAACVDGHASNANVAIDTWYTRANGAVTPTITAALASGQGAQLGITLMELTEIPTTSFVRSSGKAVDPTHQQGHPVSTTGSVSIGDFVLAAIAVTRGDERFVSESGYSNPSEIRSAGGLANLSGLLQSRLATASGPASVSFNTAPNYDQGVMFILALRPEVNAAPSPPTGLNSTVGPTSAALSWNQVPGADSYDVERSTSASGPWSAVSTGQTGNTFAQTGLTTGTSYYYRVRANNSIGSSGWTPFGAVTPKPRPEFTFNDWYSNGTKPTPNATSMRQTWRNKLDQWATYVLTTEGKPGTPLSANPRFPGTVRRIKAPDQGFYPYPFSRNGTVSEGMGYGLYMYALASNPKLESGVYNPAAKGIADSLYRFIDNNKNPRGVMNWHILEDGTIGDYNGATDGEFEIIEGLRVLSVIHGDDGDINYGYECERMMEAVERYEFVPETGHAYPNLMLCGDGWGVDTDIYMADYARIAYWRGWAKWLRARGGAARIARAERWEKIIDVNLDFIQHYIDSTQYLAGVPDRQTRTYGTIGGDGNNQITYNSVRLPLGFMLDPLWHGSEADPRCLQFMMKIANRAKQVFVTGGNIKAPNYSPDLSSYQGYENLTGTGYIAMCSLGAPSLQQFASEAYADLAASNEYASSYFNGGIGVLSLAVLSGAAQPFALTGDSGGGGGEEPTPVPDVVRIRPRIKTGPNPSDYSFVEFVGAGQ